jgi:DNA-binding transcriptional LysR family regulator
MDRLVSMEVFVATVTRGSFTAAARAFRITPSMVGKHIRNLEERLGVRLLTRTTRRQSLTEAGRRYFERCVRILEEVRNAEAGAEALRAAPKGQLRITAPISFGALRLAPALANYLASYPEVSVELDLDDAVVDLVKEGYDAAIRVGKLADSALVARRLEPFRMIICAAPSYLARVGAPETPPDLIRHACLGFTLWRKYGGWTLVRTGLTPENSAACRFRSNNALALRMAALEGVGLVLQPETVLAEDVAAGRLVEVLSEYVPPPRPMSLIYPRDRQPTPKVTTFIEFVLRRFGTKRTRQSKPR